MAEQTDSSLAAQSGDASTPAPPTALDVLSTVSAIQPEAHATADDVQEAVQQLDKLTEIENGLTEAAREVNVTGDDQQQHMQHAEQLEQQMEDQVNGLNLPVPGPVSIHSESAQSMAVQGVEDAERDYASSEDAEGEIDLDLEMGAAEDDEYDPNAYGQNAGFDLDQQNAQNDAYNESSTKDEAMPISTSAESNQAEQPIVPDESKAQESKPLTSDPLADQPQAQPEVEEVKPVAIRRPAGQQRRSPSYNMEPPQTASNDTPIPIPPPFLPAKPMMVEQNPPVRQYPSRIDLADVTFPEGLSVNSPSVQRHGAWVRAWKGGQLNFDAVSALVLIVNLALSAEGFPQTQAQALLELFKVARDEGDVEDARAWFNELTKENPTVVRNGILP